MTHPTTEQRELLELAAKAAGYAFAGHDFLPEGAAWAHEIGAEPNYDGELPIFMWNPLHDDGDALRLAVKLRMSVVLADCECCCQVYARELDDDGIFERFSQDFPDATSHDAASATRRAIVRAAAAIAKGEK